MKKYEEKLPLVARINDVLARKWRLAVLIFCLFALLMTGILVFYKVQENRENSSARLAEEIQEAYTDWMQQVAGERNDEELTQLIDQALDKYPRLFAGQRAVFTSGLMALEKENMEEAAASFMKLAETWEDSYLAPVSLSNAAAAMENAGNIEGAKQAWMEMINTYSDLSPDVPEAIFHLGRLAEAEGQTDEALKRYREVASRFPDSRWTNLSKSRILALEGS